MRRHEGAAAFQSQWLDRARHVPVQLAFRTQGWFVPRGNPNGVRSIADLARPELRFVNRFVPILRARYFFAGDAGAIERPALRLALSLMHSPDFRAVVDALSGYDGRIAGTVVPVQHAFARSRK